MAPRFGRTAGLLAAAAVFAACDGDRRTNSPTPLASPSAALQGVVAGSLVTVVRGDTGAPVEGAAVTVALGTLVLWPRSTAAGIDEAFTVTIVYTRATLSGVGPPEGEPLRRLASGATTAVIVPDADILGDEFSHAAHVLAVARINAAAQGAVTYALAPEAPATGPVFTARIDVGDPGCGDRVLGLVRNMVRGGEIVGGEIVYCSRVAPHRLALVVHEMGHTFGLQHSLDPRDMMFHTMNAAHANEFRPREVEVMSLMMQRRGGNRFPDSDREVSGLSTGEALIVCH